MFKQLKNDIRTIMDRDPAARSFWEVFFLYPGFKAIMRHRIAHKLYNSGHFFLAERYAKMTRKKYGIEIHPAAKIGNGVFIDHGMGIVIGETAVIGDNCTIYQGVTLGGTGKDKGKRHPTIGNNVLIGCGAKVLGPFTVGDNCKIAANAVVLQEVPPNCTCVGIPARIVRRNNEKVETNNFDHIHTPDPVSQELCKLLVRIEHLEKRLEEKEHENI
ncbi:MAG: serine O-acetyltransferase [Clostridia bacterium]|nr:serine O-acetyltransferase [Clostridia bacterium]